MEIMTLSLSLNLGYHLNNFLHLLTFLDITFNAETVFGVLAVDFVHIFAILLTSLTLICLN